VYAIFRTVRGELTIGTLTFSRGRDSGREFGHSGRAADILRDCRPIDVPDRSAGIHQRSADGNFEAGGLPVPRPIQRGFEFCNALSSIREIRGVCRTMSVSACGRRSAEHLGENGEGKTAIVNLLKNGADLFPQILDIVFAKIDAVKQDLSVGRVVEPGKDVMRYEKTVTDNIAVGRLEVREDTAQIQTAAAERR
jgi:ATP-binding cassette, subfamily B, bacterial